MMTGRQQPVRMKSLDRSPWEATSSNPTMVSQQVISVQVVQEVAYFWANLRHSLALAPSIMLNNNIKTVGTRTKAAATFPTCKVTYHLIEENAKIKRSGPKRSSNRCAQQDLKINSNQSSTAATIDKPQKIQQLRHLATLQSPRRQNSRGQTPCWLVLNAHRAGCFHYPLPRRQLRWLP